MLKNSAAGFLNILTFASNRTRRDDTRVDEDEYEDDEEYEDENHGKQHESRRARILRGALARRKRLAEKNSLIRWGGKQTLRCSPVSGWMMTKRLPTLHAVWLPTRTTSLFFGQSCNAARI
ncbi:hypothetical protein ACP0HM_00895 [Escherichia coli]